MSTPFAARRGLIVLPAEITGPAGAAIARLALDTGAVRSVLDRALLAEVGFDPDSASRRERTFTAGGWVEMPLVVIDSLTALGQRRGGLEVLAHTIPTSRRWRGLLGLDFLRDRALTIDFRAGTITLA